MSKIAIISQPEQGVLIDVGGCSTLKEALEHLSGTLQSSNQFWKGSKVLFGLGSLELTNSQAAQVLAIGKGVGVFPDEVFSSSEKTRAAFAEHGAKVIDKIPMSLPKIKLEMPKGDIPFAEADEDADEKTPHTVSDVTLLEVETIEVEPEEDGEDGKKKPEPGLKESSIDGNPVDAAQLPQVLYVKQTLRSGQVVSHKGDLVIVGDVNPGAEIMAEGDITVWGSLRGIAHAGVGGNSVAEIRALNLQPIQIRIASAIARAPDRPRISYASGTGPETARIVEGKIRIQKSKAD
ncbi:MAG: septum site-determining protein MinC [Cyanobacteria bacterium SZAS TMP-1]|nr:septum site-determining protein MinC [Cyanobacteria bacterium SZAS TMP-1]